MIESTKLSEPLPLLNASVSVSNMKKMTYVLVSCVAWLSLSAAHADPSFPSEVKVGTKTLSRLGVGTRKATIFKVKVYDAALFVEDKAKFDANDDTTKVVRLQFMRDVGAKDIRNAWKEGLEKTCPNPCALDLTEFLANFEDMKKDGTQEYTLTPDSVKVEQNGTAHEYKQKGLAKAILNVWVGNSPPNPELKSGMLGH